ncbi:unnamed protein product [Angiostrongylus costaricensis]|uniref:Uncharacterized protein n=1 Tax=Angiostrongylus costaricensis TaxID=334426 RepID=A0A0R3PUQ0_ANGCS|nr:unnamed protein product [Angiostrongylus costaricensis]
MLRTLFVITMIAVMVDYAQQQFVGGPGVHLISVQLSSMAFKRVGSDSARECEFDHVFELVLCVQRKRPPNFSEDFLERLPVHNNSQGSSTVISTMNDMLPPGRSLVLTLITERKWLGNNALAGIPFDHRKLVFKFSVCPLLSLAIRSDQMLRTLFLTTMIGVMLSYSQPPFGGGPDFYVILLHTSHTDSFHFYATATSGHSCEHVRKHLADLISGPTSFQYNGAACAIEDGLVSKYTIEVYYKLYVNGPAREFIEIHRPQIPNWTGNNRGPGNPWQSGPGSQGGPWQGGQGRPWQGGQGGPWQGGQGGSGQGGQAGPWHGGQGGPWQGGQAGPWHGGQSGPWQGGGPGT